MNSFQKILNSLALACAKSLDMRVLLLSTLMGLLPILGYTQVGPGSNGDNATCTIPQNCGAVSIHILKRASNVANDCNKSLCGGGNNFYQMPYDVYLRMPHPGGTSSFDPLALNYEILNVNVRLNVSIFSGIARSRINWGQTVTCFEQDPDTDYNPASVAFQYDPTNEGVGINFGNEIPGSGNCNTTGQQIIFKYGYIKSDGEFESLTGPNGSPTCSYYAKLFTLIVDAYPGEQTNIECDYNSNLSENPNYYVSKSLHPLTGNQLKCDLFCTNNSTITNANLPATFVGTANANIELALETNQFTTFNGCEFNVNLKNTSIQAITVSYVEFLLKVSSDYNLEEPFASIVSGSGNPIITRLGDDYFIHFKIPMLNPLTIQGNTSATVGTVQVPEIQPYNLDAPLEISMVETDKYRIQTTAACTQLKIPNSISEHRKSCAGSGNDEGCTQNVSDPLSQLRFKLEGTSASGCNFGVNAGFYTTQPPQQTAISNFYLRVKLVGAGSAQYTGITWASGWWCGFTSNCAGQGVGTCDFFDPITETFTLCINTPFALSMLPEAMFSINFTGVPGKNPCIDAVIVEELWVEYNGSNAICVPLLEQSNIPICGLQSGISGRIATESDNGEDVYLVSEVSTVLNFNSCVGGCGLTSEAYTQGAPIGVSDDNYSHCICSTCSEAVLTPSNDNNHINGVSTFDLVLISKHILGVAPLTSPYKMIAADANKSGSITTFDIVELRKLILGIYTKLPTNKSWRFIPKDYSFQNPSNPFAYAFPETKEYANVDPAMSIQNADFVAIKVGDLNGNAVANSKPASRPVTSIAWEIQSASAKGHTLLVPIRYTGAEMLEAIQLGLRFDTDKLKLKGTVIGEVPGFLPENFNLAEADKGIIKANWVLWADALQIKPGQVLFYLNFEVKDALPEDAASLLQLDDNLMENIAWRTDDQEFSLQYQAQGKTSALPEMLQNEVFSVRCFPNPGSGFAQFGVNTRQGGKYRVSLNDAAGQRLLLQDLHFAGPGEQTLQLQGSEKLPAGVYLWRVWNSTHKLQGIWIKQ